jgi:hypothetical protein
LQRTRVMRLAAAAALASALFAAPAHAQGTMGPAQMCTPTFSNNYTLAATMGLSICPNGDCSNPTSIAPSSVGTTIGLADCLCNASDLFVSIQVTSTNIPQGTAQSYQVWEGANCNQSINRISTNVTCSQVTATTDSLEYTLGSNAAQFFYQQVNVPALINPQAPSCPQVPTIGNALWMLFNTNLTMSDDCTITLSADTQLPEAPIGPSATSGDGAITLNWTLPPTGSLQPIGYQVLCADTSGAPVASVHANFAGANEPGYSTCTPNGLQRKAIATAGTTTGGDDGGVTPLPDMALATAPLQGASAGRGPGMGAQGTGPDGGTAGDGGVTDCTADPTHTCGGLNHLDHAFLCSHQLSATTTQTRIEGLTNGETYQFIIVGFDNFGNASPSDVLYASPQPVEDLWRRFRDEGGQKQGFCFVATAAYGSPESPFVEVLRDFRDTVLDHFDGGRRFIAWYYQNSPRAAGWIAQHEEARFAARQALWTPIVLAGLWMWLAAWQKALLVTLAFALAGYRRFRRVVALRRSAA